MRPLPWRQTTDAYRIFLSEIILQQTRVVQGLPYYERFVSTYPTVTALAQASEDEVLKLWQGLGYYSRARHMLQAARQVVERHQGIFPTHYDTLLQLDGIGTYTAAAIASFSADERVAVVDGNVYRVLSRVLNIDIPINTTAGARIFREAATLLMAEAESPRMHNQAMMELGALCCTPISPQCDTRCPLTHRCEAYNKGITEQRPVKLKRTTMRERPLQYIIYKYNNTLWVRRRGAGDIWQGLWEFVQGAPTDRAKPLDLTYEPVSLKLRHQLTHQLLIADFWLCQVSAEQEKIIAPDLEAEGYEKVSWQEWQTRAVPRLFEQVNTKLSAWF